MQALKNTTIPYKNNNIMKAETRPAILAIDDKAINLSFIKLSLEKDFNMFITTSGERALSIVTTKKIDLILLDIEMPDMSGFDFMERFNTHVPPESRPPVIFVTAFATPELLAHAKVAGAVGYVLKPFEPEILRKKIEEALAITKTEKARLVTY